jgi:hypothetical protein
VRERRLRKFVARQLIDRLRALGKIVIVVASTGMLPGGTVARYSSVKTERHVAAALMRTGSAPLRRRPAIATHSRETEPRARR